MSILEDQAKVVEGRKKELKKIQKDKSATLIQLREARKRLKRSQRKFKRLTVIEARRSKAESAEKESQAAAGEEGAQEE